MDLNYACVETKSAEGKLSTYLNHSKIKEEDAFEIIKQNSLDAIKEGTESGLGEKMSFPVNFDVLKKLLARKGVYCTPVPSPNHFKGNKFIQELTTLQFKSRELNGIAKKVNELLLQGAKVYIFSYYVMTIDKYIDDELTISEPWFWFRLASRIDK